MDKKELRNLRAMLWNYRGKYGVDNVHLVMVINESFDGRGDPQDESYDTIVTENLYVELPDGLTLIYSGFYESLYGVDRNEHISALAECHKECIKLASYFNGMNYFLREYDVSSEYVEDYYETTIV